MIILSILSLFFITSRKSQKKNSTGLGLPWTHILTGREDHTAPAPRISGKPCFLTPGTAGLLSAPQAPTCLAGNDHGLHRQLEELVQHQVQEEHEGLQAGGVEADDAELQLVLQRRLGDLLIQHADGEGHLALQGVAEGEELLQVVVLGRQTAGLMGLSPSTFTSDFITTIK